MSRYIDAEALDKAFSKLRFNNDGELNHYGDRPNWCLWGSEIENLIADAPSIDLVRCKECRWYDPPHILHKDGTRTDVDEGSPWVTVDVGINCDGQCVHHIDLKTYCVNHDRENPDDNESIVIFRSPDDFCSYGEREGE